MKNNNTNNLLEYNYSKEDSLFFNSDLVTEDENSTAKIIEKEVDYQRELLDFRNEKLSKKPGNNSTATDKIIDINEAGEDDFTSLDGIGSKTAKNIIEYRKKVGRFINIDQLMDVKGIGKTKFDKFKNKICVK